jgi:hypothetical protein
MDKHIDSLIEICFNAARSTASGQMTPTRAREVHRNAYDGIRAIETQLKGQIEKYRQHNVHWLKKRSARDFRGVVKNSNSKPKIVKKMTVNNLTVKKLIRE